MFYFPFDFGSEEEPFYCCKEELTCVLVFVTLVNVV